MDGVCCNKGFGSLEADSTNPSIIYYGGIETQNIVEW